MFLIGKTASARHCWALDDFVVVERGSFPEGNPDFNLSRFPWDLHTLRNCIVY